MRNPRNKSKQTPKGQDSKVAPGKKTVLPVALEQGLDYTAKVIGLLETLHGNIRTDELGEYYYRGVSVISLHFLLNSGLPSKEVLWAWYAHFEGRHSESVYQNLHPAQDEVLLDILSDCEFLWDKNAVLDSGLIFTEEHRRSIFAALEAALNQRLEYIRNLEEGPLQEWLRSNRTDTDSHLRRRVRTLQTQPLEEDARTELYASLKSDYLRATARQMLDDACKEAFWKTPPPELELMGARFKTFFTRMREEATRLGIFISPEAHEARKGAGSHHQRGRRRQRGGHTGKQDRGFNNGGRGGPWESDSRNGPRSNMQGRRGRVGMLAVLELQPHATMEDIKLAYREKVKEYHPDQGGTVQKFLEIQEAYEHLMADEN